MLWKLTGNLFSWICRHHIVSDTQSSTNQSTWGVYAADSDDDDWTCLPAVDIKAQLQSAELRNKRLIEQFKKTSQELRHVVYQLLGFRIDIPNTGQYRLMNMYAESANDYFLFTVSSSALRMIVILPTTRF